MYIYGRNVAKDTKNIKRAFVQNNFKDKELLNSLNVPIKFVDKHTLDNMVSGNHQGIILEVEDYKYADISGMDDVIVMLDHLEDPHNLGAIIRTCEAGGINSIIIPKDRSVKVTDTVIKTSVGTCDKVKIAQVTNLVNTINDLKKNGYWIIGTDMEGTPYTDIDYNGKIVIVIGNEGNGMSRLVKESCDFIATIPMYGTTNSLNASVATGIVLFEAIKQRGE